MTVRCEAKACAAATLSDRRPLPPERSSEATIQDVKQHYLADFTISAHSNHGGAACYTNDVAITVSCADRSDMHPIRGYFLLWRGCTRLTNMPQSMIQVTVQATPAHACCCSPRRRGCPFGRRNTVFEVIETRLAHRPDHQTPPDGHRSTPYTATLCAQVCETASTAPSGLIARPAAYSEPERMIVAASIWVPIIVRLACQKI